MSADVIGIEEFTRLQTQFLQERESHYEAKEKLKYIQNEFNKLQDIINKSKKTVEFSNLQKEKDILLRNLEAANKENKEQQSALRENIKGVYKNNEDLTNQLKSLQSQVEEGKNQLKLKEEEARNHQAQMARLKKQNAESQEKLKDRTKQMENLKKEIESIDISSIFESKEGEESKAKIEVENLLLKLSNSTVHQEGKKAPQNLQAESSSFVDPLTGISSQAKENVENSVNEEEDSVQSESVEENQEENSNRTEETTPVEEKEEEKVQIDDQKWKEMEENNEKYQSELKNYTEKDEKQSKTIQELRNQINKLESQEKSLKEQIEAFREQVNSISTDQKKEKSKELEDLKKSHATLIQAKEKENAALQQSIDKLKQEIKKAQVESEKHKEEVNMVHEDREHMIMKMSQKDLKIDELKDELAMERGERAKDKENFEKEKETMKNSLQEKAGEINQANQTKSAIENATNQLRDQLLQISKENQTLQEKINSLKEEMRENEEQVKIKTSQIAAYKESTLHLNEDINRMQEEMKEMKAKSDNYFGLLSDNRTALEDEMAKGAKLQEQLDSTLKQLEELKETHEETTATLESVTAHRDKIKEKFKVVNAESKQLKEDYETLKQNHLETGEQLTTIKWEYEKCQRELEEIVSKFKANIEECDRLAKENEESQKKATDMETAARDAQVEQKIIEKKMTRFEKDFKQQIIKERREYEKQIESLTAQLVTANSGATRPVTQLAKAGRMNSSPNLMQNNNSALSNSVMSMPLTYQPLPESKPSNPTQTALGVTVDVLQDDINSLAMEKGKLIIEKISLEEQLRVSQDELEKLKAESAGKEILIREYVLKSKIDGRAEEVEVNKSEKKGFWGFGGAREKDLDQERVVRMEAVLQDTMLRNIQLQNDVTTLGNEIARLTEEMKKTKNKTEEPERKIWIKKELSEWKQFCRTQC
eukprot:TRINITY_DN1632_c0_g1_i8.p1 TRINITY_DN1632_c0_g1~~TRINITY_DN1632_c0_g1_i8.p1  ORF type:complete len:940 (+),score=473.42 TRINITY_DN1632_c0_g1_i8:2953-5772(+)